MTTFLVRRLLHAAVALLGISLVVFVSVRISGDPAELMLQSGGAGKAELDELRHSLGLDEPLPTQYWTFLTSALHGDLGYSYWQRQPAFGLILERFPATLELATGAVLVLVAVSFPAGIYAALHRQRLPDVVVTSLTSLGQAMPVFWAGPLLILVFAVGLRWLPAFGRGDLAHLILPALTLAAVSAARLTRVIRSETVDALGAEFARTARAKGLHQRTVLYRHIMPVTLIPVVTILALEFGAMLGGAVITETIFAWPGVGRLLIQAVQNRDFPLVQATTLFIATIFVFLNLLVDIAYAFLDPRIRLGAEG